MEIPLKLRSFSALDSCRFKSSWWGLFVLTSPSLLSLCYFSLISIIPLGPLCFFLGLAFSVSHVLLFFFFSVPNLFLFTSSPVFCSVSRFKSFPFKSVFLWIWQSKIPWKRGKNKLWLLCCFFFLLQLQSLKKKTWNKTKQNGAWRGSLWNPNWNELN